MFKVTTHLIFKLLIKKFPDAWGLFYERLSFLFQFSGEKSCLVQSFDSENVWDTLPAADKQLSFRFLGTFYFTIYLQL